MRQSIFWPFQHPRLSHVKKGASLPPAGVICSCGRGWTGVWVQLGHGYRIGLSSKAVFSVFCQAGTHSF